MSHSPGPWREEIDDDGNVLVVMDEGHSVYFGNMEGTCGTCHANATLVSRAPEMVEILKKVETMMWDGDVVGIVGLGISQLLDEATRRREPKIQAGRIALP